MYMQVAIIGGIILSLPNSLYQLWAFISRGSFRGKSVPRIVGSRRSLPRVAFAIS
jgi:hypothetical protein